MKHLTKHIVDASIGGLISFISIVCAMEEFSYKALGYAFLSGLLVGLIKIREYFNMNGRSKKMGYLFF